MLFNMLLTVAANVTDLKPSSSKCTVTTSTQPGRALARAQTWPLVTAITGIISRRCRAAPQDG